MLIPDTRSSVNKKRSLGRSNLTCINRTCLPCTALKPPAKRSTTLYSRGPVSQFDRPRAHTPYQILFILHMPALCPPISPFETPTPLRNRPPLQLSQCPISSFLSGSAGDLGAEVCQFQDTTDDPTLLSRGRERESASVTLRSSRSVEFSLIVCAAGRGWNTNS